MLSGMLEYEYLSEKLDEKLPNEITHKASSERLLWNWKV